MIYFMNYEFILRCGLSLLGFMRAFLFFDLVKRKRERGLLRSMIEFSMRKRFFGFPFLLYTSVLPYSGGKVIPELTKDKPFRPPIPRC